MTLRCVLLLAIAFLNVPQGLAQSQAGAPASTAQASAASDKLAFEVASVKRSNPRDAPSSNFSLALGAIYTANPGFFSASSYPLVTYIAFAYEIQPNQVKSFLSNLPDWLTTDLFTIEARAKGRPTKDQMRLMMRSLLADRFKLALHTEPQEVPAFGLVLVKPGITGPQLQPYKDDSSCSNNPDSLPWGPGQQMPTVAGGLPAICGGTMDMAASVPGRRRLGGRDVTMAQIANSFPASELGRPLLEQTGLSGTFNYLFEWTPQTNRPLPPSVDSQADPSGLTFLEALRDQLGLKLVAQKGSIDAIVVDHVEHPTEN